MLVLASSAGLLTRSVWRERRAPPNTNPMAGPITNLGMTKDRRHSRLGDNFYSSMMSIVWLEVTDQVWKTAI